MIRCTHTRIRPLPPFTPHHVVVQRRVAREARGGVAAVAAAPGGGEHTPAEGPRRFARGWRHRLGVASAISITGAMRS